MTTTTTLTLPKVAPVAPHFWEFLSSREVVSLAGTSQSWRSLAPWRYLVSYFFGCRDEATAAALRGWRPAFGALSWVVAAGEDRNIAELHVCLRGLHRLAISSSSSSKATTTTTMTTSHDDDWSSGAGADDDDQSTKDKDDAKAAAPPPLAALAQVVCDATARAFADESTRLALCRSAEREACGVAVAAAMEAWPSDAKLAERGGRALVYVQLAGAGGRLDGAMRSAFEAHRHSPAVAENACAYALAVATEYTKRMRRAGDDDAANLEALAATNFYEDVVVEALAAHLADQQHDARRDDAASASACARGESTLIFYACGALRELALAAKIGRSAACARAVDNLRDDLARILHSIAVRLDAPERTVRYAISAMNHVAAASPKHRERYAVYAPKVKAALRGVVARREQDSPRGHRVPSGVQ